MVTKFNIFESVNWNESDNYIVCLPSGEIIYVNKEELDYFRGKNYVYFDDRRGKISIEKWVCSDFFVPKIMEYLNNKRKNESLKSTKRINSFLVDCGLESDQYSILNTNKNELVIVVFGSINLAYRELKRIPFKFKRCTGNFTCSHNNLETLENAPDVVQGDFDCSYNLLKDLKGGPKEVSKLYNCSHNKLTTLQGCPVRAYDFNCSFNFLKDLNIGPIVRGNFIKNDNLFK